MYITSTYIYMHIQTMYMLDTIRGLLGPSWSGPALASNKTATIPRSAVKAAATRASRAASGCGATTPLKGGEGSFKGG